MWEGFPDNGFSGGPAGGSQAGRLLQLRALEGQTPEKGRWRRVRSGSAWRLGPRVEDHRALVAVVLAPALRQLQAGNCPA